MNLIWLPVELFRLTIDLWRLTCGWMNRGDQQEQPCAFCVGSDTGCAPRPLPCGLRSYRNLWLIRWAMPCVAKARSPRRQRVFLACHKEGGHIVISKWVPACAILLTTGWLLLALVILHQL